MIRADTTLMESPRLRLPRWWLLACALAVTMAGFPVLAAVPGAVTPPFVMGTDTEETSLPGKWYRRIYREAFRRMEMPLTIVVLPLARLTTMADDGEIHGQPSRLAAYAESHPSQVRVGEAVNEVRLALYAFVPAAKIVYPKRLEDLTSGKWSVEYRRGVVFCEKTLKPLVPAEKLSDISNTEQGMKKLQAGRTDLFCEFDLTLESELLTSEFKGVSGFRPVLDLGLALPVYPYVHKTRSDLAPLLAATLKKMKAEGLIERYYSEARRELEAAR